MNEMSTDVRSPLITYFSWGRLEVEGGRRFKDAKLFPGGSREWDWSETGTDHEPGIQPADVEEVLEHGAKVVVLSKGNYERLQTCSETLEMLKQRGIAFHMLQTEQAIDLYNKLRENEPVAGLFHSTC
jgi:hypothetical protein